MDSGLEVSGFYLVLGMALDWILDWETFGVDSGLGVDSGFWS